jgi:hypothetical protein
VGEWTLRTPFRGVGRQHGAPAARAHGGEGDRQGGTRRQNDSCSAREVPNRGLPARAAFAAMRGSAARRSGGGTTLPQPTAV